MGLGALMGMGGDAGGGAAPGGDAEALLQQITDLMDQYLALGQDTPAFQVISDALPAIQEAMGGGGDMGAMPPGEEGPAAPGETHVAPEGEQGSPMDMMPSSPPQGFDDASSMALDEMKKRKGKGY